MGIGVAEISDFRYEVNLFGPGYGESILVRIGEKDWLVVDSCLNEEGRPAPLAYLDSIGVPYEHVKLVIASHWHDDHVRGISTIVEECLNAKVCLGLALTKKEFFVFVSIFNKSHPKDNFTSGTRELYKVLMTLKNRKQNGMFASPDRCLWSAVSDTTGTEVLVWSLSPSDACTYRFLEFISAVTPKSGETKFRAPAIKENETAIALLIKFGESSVLLGADLEETHQGWSAILDSPGRKRLKSSLFKVPHHGSENGHHDRVWSEMLTQNPIAIMTPYNRGHKLPKGSDIERIQGLTSTLYTTRVLNQKIRPARSKSIEKSIKLSSNSLTPTSNLMGHIKVELRESCDEWCVDLNSGATLLQPGIS